MTLSAVHQFVPALVPRDAVGGHTLGVRDLLREMGYESEIFAKDAWGGMEDRAHHYLDYAPRDPERTCILYQAATGSPVGDFLIERPEPIILDYHNVTPASFYEKWEVVLLDELRAGRRQIETLASRAVLGVADSEFNAADLRAMGCRRTEVVPVFIDYAQRESEVDPEAEARVSRLKERDGGVDLLFVGRLSPHKAQHDLVKALALYREAFDPNARLHLVGTSSSWNYYRALRGYIADLGLAEAVSMPGSVPRDELVAFFRTADAYVSVSEHEGFCIPVIEAMLEGVPVVAYGAGAVPDTVGDAGVVLPSKDPSCVASALYRVLSDHTLAQRLVDAGRRRAGAFSLEVSRRRFRDVVGAALEEIG